MYYYNVLISNFMVNKLKLSGLDLLVYAALFRLYSTDMSLITHDYSGEMKVEYEYLTELTGCYAADVVHLCANLAKKQLINYRLDEEVILYKITDFDKYSKLLR